VKGGALKSQHSNPVKQLSGAKLQLRTTHVPDTITSQ
jgi:hypothetical protein